MIGCRGDGPCAVAGQKDLPNFILALSSCSVLSGPSRQSQDMGNFGCQYSRFFSLKLDIIVC